MSPNSESGFPTLSMSDVERMFERDYDRLASNTDRVFGGLMIFQWAASIFLALVVSPHTWTGSMSSTHIHVWTAVVLGGIISSLPLVMIWLRPGRTETRHVIAVAQMLYGAMLIHLTGGRIETHFHVFGSLAFLAFYRDWKVLVSASAVVAVDHLLRGMFWPESVFGVVTASQFRWLEHAGWVVFEDVFLISQCMRGIAEMRHVAQRHCELEATNAVIEKKVERRTRELAEHRERLEETVAERTAALEVTLSDLRQTNAELEDANRHRNRFLSTMSHELRTPLNSILGFSDLLDCEGFGPLNEKQKNYIQRISTSGTHLLSLINDVLDVSRIDVGAMVLNTEQIDVRQLINSVESIVSAQLAKKQIRLSVEIEDDIGAVMADERKAKQIIINLLTNAIKYSPESSKIRIECRRATESWLRFAVIDRGVGISDDHCGRVFDEFHQVDRKRDEAIGGIGLGLSLCKRLVTLHGGEIGVSSVLGKGSEFWFVLPSGAPAKKKKPAQKSTKVISGTGTLTHSAKILIAEDNEMNLALLMETLSLVEAEVFVAHNGQECIDLAIAQHPDVIVTDIRMPVLDGLEATRRLRAMPEFGETPIIALTANASKVSRSECMSAGCTDYVSKPIEPRRLIDVINRYLSPVEVGSEVGSAAVTVSPEGSLHELG